MRESKQQQGIKRKPLKGGQLNRQLKFTNKQSEAPHNKSKVKENESIENVSLIEGASFISNKQDGSMDSMDKMIIGVTSMGIDEKEFEDESEHDHQAQSKESKGSVELDFTYIHKQYEKLIGKNKLLGEEDEENEGSDAEVQENSRGLIDQEEWHMRQSEILSKRLLNLSQTLSPKKGESYLELKHRLLRIQAKIQQLKPKKSQDISNNSIKILASNLGNLSQIHEEKQKENYLNTSVNTSRKLNINEEDEQEFIDFVRQPDPHVTNENETQNEVDHEGQNAGKKNFLHDENIAHGWEVSPAIFENLELEISKDKKKKEKSRHYQQILEALNSKEEEEEEETPPSQLVEVLNRRENWIKTHPSKSEQWKAKELALVSKMKRIIRNPHHDSSDSDG